MAAGARVRLDIDEMRFGDGPPLLAGLRLDVRPGEAVALTGQSGVGKSTLLRIIAGLERGYTGRLGPVPAAAVMFQDPRLLPWLTVTRNLRVAVAGLSAAEAGRRLAEVGLGGLGEAYPHELSLGMQRRAALARALAVPSPLLVLDEPFASLDPPLSRAMQELVAAHRAETGATLIFATHEAAEAARLADRVFVLAGRPVAMTTA